MSNDEIEMRRLRLDEQRLEIEKARLALDSSSKRNYSVPLFGVLTAVVAGLFALAPVGVAYLQKDKELDLSASERDRRWKLDMVEFVFRNRDVIFSESKGEEQQRIIRVMLVAFPPEISGPVFEKVKADAPPEQKPQWEQAQLLLESGRQQQSPDANEGPPGTQTYQPPPATPRPQTSPNDKYYVIAMTSSDCKDIDREIERVKLRSPGEFSRDFPDVVHYAPPDGACTLLVSAKGLPFDEANRLKDKAKAAGFSRDTWLWQSTVWYFAAKQSQTGK